MSKSVLVTDDSKVLRMIVSRHLTQFGVETIEAENGEVGIVRAREYHPDLILLDYNMPVLDGYQTLERLKHDPDLRAIPVIMLTTETASETVVRLIKLGLKDYIAKPFSREDLLKKLNSTLQLYDGDAVPPELAAVPAHSGKCAGSPPVTEAIEQKPQSEPSQPAKKVYRFLTSIEDVYVLRFPGECDPCAETFTHALVSEVPLEIDQMMEEGRNRFVLQLSPLVVSTALITKKFGHLVRYLQKRGIVVKAVIYSERVKEAFHQDLDRQDIAIFDSLEAAVASFS